jgi:hypothetical protein
MTKSEYKAARKLIRENGMYALHWMNPTTQLVMSELRYQGNDMYADIQSFFRSCTNTRNRLLYRKAVYLALMD